MKRFPVNFQYNFAPSDKFQHVYSAGILPFQVDENHQIYFLLGKDNDGCWSDFGGKCEPKDQNIILDTAAREFYEESLGCILPLTTIRKMLNFENNFELVKSSSMVGIPYYMFIVRIPMLPNDTSLDRFKKTFEFIQYMNQDDKAKIPYAYLEKVEIGWVSLDTLISILNHEKNEIELGWPLRKVFRKTLHSCKKTLFKLKNMEIYRHS